MKAVQVSLNVCVVGGVEILVGSARGHVKCDLKCELMRLKSPVKLQLDTEQNYLFTFLRNIYLKLFQLFFCLFHDFISHNSKF